MKIRNGVVAMVLGLVVMGCTEGNVSGPLLPGESLAARNPASFRPAAAPTIVDVALQVNTETGEFSTLIAAVQAAGLLDALSAVGQRTVFAPTDAAFAALGLDETNVGSLDKQVLTNILLYHVAQGRRASTDVVSAKQIRMSNGGFTRVSLSGGSVFINDSKIVAVDIAASNGIIHVIDGVLLP